MKNNTNLNVIAQISNYATAKGYGVFFRLQTLMHKYIFRLIYG